MIAAKFREAWQGVIVAVVPCMTTTESELVSAFSLGVLLIRSLVNFVADLDIESLVLSSFSARHLLATSRARYRRMAFATREAR